MDIIGGIHYLLSNYYTYFLFGLVSTVILSLFGTFVGLFLGIFLAFGKNIKINKEKDIWIIKALKYILKWICSIYSLVIRGTPMMVQAMIFKFGCLIAGLNWNNVLGGYSVFNGWFIAGLIVITFNTAAYMGEIIISGLNGVDVGQIEGAKSLGMSDIQTLWHVTLPQAIKNSIPTIGNEWIVNIKDSSVLNVIGVSELYFMSSKAANDGYKFVAAYILVAIIYLLLTLLSTYILKVAGLKMDGNSWKRSLFHFSKKGA